VTLTFAASVTFVLLKIIGATMEIKSNGKHQSEGLDLIEHEEKGYDELAYGPLSRRPDQKAP
jgi:ammonia channel protein AmtB